MAPMARDIPTITPARESHVGVAARSVPTTRRFQNSSSNPSNSFPPTLPLYNIRSYVTRSSKLQAPEHFESELDRQNSPVDSTKSDFDKNYPDIGSPSSDTAGAITPALLANHHLPDILLNHGPLAIRHIMSFLTTAVPGFSRISPTKSRRLVVSALESCTNKDESENSSNVIFEKVGWGRWNAKLPAHSDKGNKPLSSPLSSAFNFSDLPVVQSNNWKYDRTRLKTSDSSLIDSSTLFSHGNDMDIDMDITVAGNEPDKLSIDGNETCSSSSEVGEDEIMSEESSDTTDDEDWAALGAAALRAASYSTSNGAKYLSSYGCNKDVRGGGGPPLSALTKSCPKQLSVSDIEISNFDITSNSQEREAIEALLRLGSV